MTMAPSIKLDAKKLSRQIASIRSLAEKNKWIVEYDRSLDQLFFAPKVIPKGTFLVTVDNDISIYINKDSDVKGLFIEYFSHNFVEHDKEIKPAFETLLKTRANSKKNKVAEDLVIKELELKTIESFYKDIDDKTQLAVAT